MKGFDPPAMHTVLSRLIEHSNWASRSWVDATLRAMEEAVREANARNGGLADRIERKEPGSDAAERERVLISALEACSADDELRTLGLRFLKLREQFRPIWSAELPPASVMARRPPGRLIAAHRR